MTLVKLLSDESYYVTKNDGDNVFNIKC